MTDLLTLLDFVLPILALVLLILLYFLLTRD